MGAIRTGAMAVALTVVILAAEAVGVDAGPGSGGRPWLAHFYLAHGVGIESAEMPLIGTDLGPGFDDGLVLGGPAGGGEHPVAAQIADPPAAVPVRDLEMLPGH